MIFIETGIIQPMTFDAYHEFLTGHLSPSRRQHSLGVMQVMEELAPIYGLDPTAAQIAGLLHDAGKELTLPEMLAIADTMDFPLIHPADRDPLYLHGPASAYVAQHELDIDDPLILEAIYRHSYVEDGPAQSPVFCWCLRFADMLEPGRDWDELRQQMRPLIFAGQVGQAAHCLMDWLVPFLESVGENPHPYQRELQRQLAELYESSSVGLPNHDLPV